MGSENSRGGRSPREQRRICLRKLGGIRTDSRREESFEVGELLTESEFATCCPRELGDARKRVEKDSIGVGRKKEKRARERDLFFSETSANKAGKSALKVNRNNGKGASGLERGARSS